VTPIFAYRRDVTSSREGCGGLRGNSADPMRTAPYISRMFAPRRKKRRRERSRTRGERLYPRDPRIYRAAGGAPATTTTATTTTTTTSTRHRSNRFLATTQQLFPATAARTTTTRAIPRTCYACICIGPLDQTRLRNAITRGRTAKSHNPTGPRSRRHSPSLK